MYGLSSTLQSAAQSLSAESGALAVTNNNIANVNTPGYARQLVELSPAALESSGGVQSNGVAFNGYSSVRDQVLQLSINQKTSDAGSLTAQSTLWSGVESSFSGTTTGLGAAVTNFFNNLSGLSTSPNDAAARQAAFDSAGQLAGAFHQAAAALTGAQATANQTIAGTVTQINQLSSQIAALDQQLTQVQGQDGGSLQDQRDTLTTQLAQLLGINSVTTESSPMLTLSDGTPLVAGGTAYPLQAVRAADGTISLQNAAGQDITDAVSGGTLGGALAMRDQQLPGLQSTLDTFATNLASALNAVQTGGYDGSGSAGQPLFTLSATGGAAASINLALTGATQLATSSDGTTGNSANIANFVALQSTALASGFTPLDTYAGLVQNIGAQSAGVTSSLTATNASLSQLTTQQGSESGVSVDEETTNLLRYQQAYSAAAQVISTVNSLFSVVLNMSTVSS